MAEGVYLADLTAVTAAEDTDILIIETTYGTRKITFGMLRKLLGIDVLNEAKKTYDLRSEELIDIRTGADDKTYESAGEAVRAQIAAVSNSSGGSEGGTQIGIATPTVPGTVMPVAKTDAMTQEVGISESGRLYTKSPSLPENTLTGDQVANLHVWERFGGSGEITLLDPAGFTLYSYPSGTGAIYSITIYYSDTCGIVNGAVTLDAPHTLTYKTNEALSKLETLRGKYVKTDSKDTCYLVAEGATFSSESVSGTISITAIKCSSAQEVTDVSYGDLLGYVTAASRDTYPEAGIQDGYRYEYCGTIGGGVAPPTDTIEEGNPNPVTSGAVAAQFGNIEAALDAMIEKAGGTT